MSLITQLIGFGLRQVIGDSADNIVPFVEVVEQRFRDHSRTLPKALEQAHNRAWQALGVALAGDGLLDRVKVFFASGDDKGVREQVQVFLNSNAVSFAGTGAEFRQACLDELKRLRKSGLLSTQGGSSADLARQAAGFKRHTDPQGLIEESRRAVAGVADALAGAYPNLCRLLRTPTPAGPPLLAAAFCYFFRREVETDDELAHGLFRPDSAQKHGPPVRAVNRYGNPGQRSAAKACSPHDIWYPTQEQPHPPGTHCGSAEMSELTGVTIKATPWKVRNLAALKRNGELHLPDLQRGFRWSPERVRDLHDSLYRRYPVGALLLWKPSWSGEDAPFATRAWDTWLLNSATGKVEREAAAPVRPGAMFVLDGQQRLTSLFRVIFQSRAMGKNTFDPDLLVALSPESEWLDNPFHLRSRAMVRRMKDGLLVDAHVLFEGVRQGDETGAVLKAIGQWVQPSDSLFTKALNRANAIRNAILENEIVAYEIDADADDDNVIEIFARLNQQGITLRPSELAAARLTGQLSNFREKARSVLTHKDLHGYVGREGQEDRIRTGGFVDTDLLMRAALFLATGTISYRDIEKRKKGGKEGFADVAKEWNNACAALRASVKMFREAGIPEGGWIPYRYLLLAPAIAHAKGHSLTDKRWLGWAIAASIWGHHAGDAENKAQADARAAAAGDIDELLKSVKTQAKRPESVVPQEDDLTENVVKAGGVLLALLVDSLHHQTRSFPMQKFLSSHAEPIEVHHIFPRAVLNAYPEENDFIADRLGNLTLLYRSDNESIGDDRPADYLATVPQEVLKAHCIPLDQSLWAVEHYVEFCQEREKALAKVVNKLLEDLGLT